MKKINLFGEKLSKEEYMIGFAGHFSAGKSSMINALTGGELLPSSPIPTSANIVKVKKSKDDYAIIHLIDGRVTKYSSANFSEAVKLFSKNGEEVALVEIGHHESSLPDGITVMDTPGVDSTDERHHASTESALHLADLVFYTMDYNHVQSELNFTFTKELMEYNPNVYLIINQIDKHRENELPFELFKQSVESSFRMWGVQPKGIFYTSLKDLHHPHNDFQKVKTIVEDAMDDWQDHFIENSKNTLIQLRDEHEQFLIEQIDEIKEQYESIVAKKEWDEKAQLEQSLSQLQNTVQLVQGESFARKFDRARTDLIDNASITPFETRELLREYLESLSNRFKVGLLFSSKKTKEEKLLRRKKFEENIKHLLHTQIDVHLKRLMKEMLKDAFILTDERSLEIDDLQFSISLNKIEKNFQPSDAITGETVLNYANQMKVNIQHAYKQLTDEWKENMVAIVTETSEHTSGKAVEEIQLLKEKLKAVTSVERLILQKEQISKIMEQPPIQLLKEGQLLIEQWAMATQFRELTEIDFSLEEKEDEREPEYFEEKNEKLMSFIDSEIEEKLVKARHVANVLSGHEGFSDTATYLKEKAKRIQSQSYTVALFGAFSAGKSSFSNALIGENILPVSPNPTTATINKIRPVEEGKVHNSADVVLKTKKRMTEDIVRSFEALNVPVKSLDEAFGKVSAVMESHSRDEKQQMHKAFIQAFAKGYEKFQGKLGKTIHVNREQFVRYVAEEERSCFVESIDFYFDCDLTRKGITLVDTPGADSINARHTDVAFEYIRNADAILFVTYYNHAFARADQEFLIQLGRVKDAFEMDKMFFIVNAIDLAKDLEEAKDVQTYVSKELQKFGIRHPRIFGLSSLKALEDKINHVHNEELAQFERSFQQFLKNDLRGLAVQGLDEETEKIVERLKLLIDRTEANRLRKDERLEELSSLEQKVRARFQDNITNIFIDHAKNELAELIHYVHQRVFLRFNSFFKEAYHPSVFSRFSKEEALKIALKEILQMVGFDLTQEMKVTNLRMLHYMTKQLLERQKSEEKLLKSLDETMAPIAYEPSESELLTFSFPFKDPTNYGRANRFFRNSRSFFERGESEKTKEYLERALKEDALQYLHAEQKRIEQWIQEWFAKEAPNLQSHLMTECFAQIESERALLQVEEQLDEWKTLYEKIIKKECV